MTVRRAGLALVALACAGLAGWLAWHHPLSPPAALIAVTLLALVCLTHPGVWPVLLLGLLPMVGLMTWTGWLIVEETDLAVLAVAAGAWTRLATGWSQGAPRLRSTAKVLLLFLPLLLSTLLSAERGVADAGGLVWGWWQGYREPLNALRLAKPLLEVLLLLPIWLAVCRENERVASRRLVLAMQWLLVGVASWVVWERLAFTGLANFSADYRATGPFWEMHVGGAGLDAALAIAMPFAVMGLAAARTPLRWAVAALVLALGLYASLATFSRIVYAAVPLGVAVWWGLRARNGPAQFAAPPPWTVLPWALGFGALAFWAFPTGGYRGMLALLGAVALLLPLGAVLRSLKASSSRPGIAAGVLAMCVLAAAASATAVALPRGAYAATALAWCVASAALFWSRARPGTWAASVAVGAWAAAVVGVVSVGVNWGGAAAWFPGLGAAAVLLLLGAWALFAPRPAWPKDGRWQAQLVLGLATVAAVVGIFGGGAYMGKRLTDSSGDGQGRQAHWGRSLALMKDGDWLLGKGLGRYWAVQTQTGRDEDQTGDLRLLQAGPGRSSQALVLTSGRHDLGSAEALRLAQRVGSHADLPVTLSLRARADTALRLDVEVCTKHLLYPGQCQGAQLSVPAQPGQWQLLSIRLKGEPFLAQPDRRPRLVVFSISLGNHARRVELDDLSLTDAVGQPMLANGDFEQGLARWYFTSDRYHMPWHMKNMALHLLFEQGLLGLSAFALLAGAALWRCAFGAARGHPLAPAMAGAIMALLLVGLVDSVLDMPRLALLTLLMLAIALALPQTRQVLKPPRGP